MLIVTALIGLTILLIGRQLFWVAIAGLGFILGLSYATQYFQGSPQQIMLISLGIGAIGALLAYVLQRTAALLVGFLAGWYLTITLIESMDWNLNYSYILAIIGGLIGVSMVSVLFDWSLILLSSLTGASLITQSLQFSPAINRGLFVVLFILGFAVQGILLSQEQNEYR
jgi:hypothetical protein